MPVKLMEYQWNSHGTPMVWLENAYDICMDTYGIPRGNCGISMGYHATYGMHGEHLEIRMGNLWNTL